MTDAPERIWAAATKWAVGHGPELDWRFGHWKETPVTVPDPKQEYLRADTALALVAEAYEMAAEEAKGKGESEFFNPVRAIRDLTPSGALAAREARDRRVKNEALRKSAGIVRSWKDCGHDFDIEKEIFALIEGDQTDG